MIYDIWMEGFMFSMDERAEASYLGQSEGATFKDAVIAWYEKNPLRKHSFNPDNLTDWGCRLFDNEVDARRNFG